MRPGLRTREDFLAGGLLPRGPAVSMRPGLRTREDLAGHQASTTHGEVSMRPGLRTREDDHFEGYWAATIYRFNEARA